MHSIDKKIQEKGLVLPGVPDPVANYVPYKIYNKTIIISGQAPIKNGKVEYAGKVGEDLSVEQGIEAARLCSLNILAILKNACNNDWNNFKEIIKLGGFVNCSSTFTEHPKIINGASDMIVEILGSKGRHSRFAVGSNSLPLNIAVEIEAIALIK